MKKKDQNKGIKILIGLIVVGFLLNHFGLIPLGVFGITVSPIYSTGNRFQYMATMQPCIKIGYVKEGSQICCDGKVFIVDDDGWTKLLVGSNQREQYCCQYSTVTDQFCIADDKICYYDGDEHNWGPLGDCPRISSGETITKSNGNIWRCGSLDPTITGLSLDSYILTNWVEVGGVSTTTTTIEGQTTTTTHPTTTTTLGECTEDETPIAGQCIKTEQLVIIGLLSLFVIGGWYYYKKK